MPRKSTTSEQQFRLYDRSFLRRIRRDVFVLRYLARILWLWLTVGRKLRRAKLDATQSGDVLYVDEIMKGGSR